MDEQTFKDRISRLKEVGKVLEALPTEIRALAFPLISDYVTSAENIETDTKSGKTKQRLRQLETSPPADREGFFKSFDHEKPSDNAKLLAAWLYGEFGTEPFSMEEIKTLATDVGITIPERINMTFTAAREKGKSLFASAGRGKFKPTVHGEAYLKETYQVTKGTKRRPGKTE